ncbi:MAG: type II toxin-antitoxin system RelE/ParE family toxin [Thermoanaerobaculia bacterium]
MRGQAPSRERPLHWVGSSRTDLLGFPEAVVGDFGYLLGVVQFGGLPPSAKPWKGEGPGVFELVEPSRGDAYRVVFTVRFECAIYVLRSFQKKSPGERRAANGECRRRADSSPAEGCQRGL